MQDLQESGQITCKTARLVQVLQDDLQDFLLSWSKICSKILQGFITWVGPDLDNAVKEYVESTRKVGGVVNMYRLTPSL